MPTQGVHRKVLAVKRWEPARIQARLDEVTARLILVVFPF